ncbi:phosphotransferase [Fulvivirgaceae bacterium BMA12]|uniref:Phosphotransferase n=1 Tax=Agaribacillus aureus TaxID=3051825 RepID=A0ABT8L978_9BACT|nr:phosphotransferase [Fulvivirgaceae bacterium BMA12]
MNRIDYNTPIATLQQLLEAKGWIGEEQIVAVEKAGESNMNMVMKVDTDRRSFILKQSRPYVFKYPNVAAPEARTLTEYRFFKEIKSTSLVGQMPTILQFDAKDYLMMMDYVHNAKDMTYLYERREVPLDSFNSLMESLNILHGSSPVDYPSNIELRELNHQHIFHLPFLEENGFALDTVQPGLQSLAEPFKTDTALKQKVKELGAHYLEPGNVLLHGDYYPGSWMQTDEQIYIIDAEFSHYGFCEFDLGVMAGHLIMVTSDTSYLDRVLKAYAHEYEEQRVLQVAGTEIIRRLIGLAQLPLIRTLEEKSQLLDMAKKLLLS